MRSALVIAAIVGLSAGTVHAQQQIQPTQPEPSKAAPVQNSESTPTTTTAAPKLPDAGAAMSEQQAKAKIEGEGYTQVSGLKKDDKGMWTATAMKDGRAVQLSLNAQGQISVLN